MGVLLVVGVLIFMFMLIRYPSYRPATKRLTWAIGLLVAAGFLRLFIGLML